MKRTRDRRLLIALVAFLATAGSSMADQPTAAFPADFVAQLRDHKEIYVATQRNNGSRSTAVPVWFGYMDNAIWFTTSPTSYKGRRVKEGSPVFVSVKGKDGPFIKTKAEVINDGAIAERLGELYSKKYWIAWVGFFRPSRARVESGKVILLRLTPVGT